MGKGTLDEGFFLCVQKRLISDQLGKRVVAEYGQFTPSYPFESLDECIIEEILREIG